MQIGKNYAKLSLLSMLLTIPVLTGCTTRIVTPDPIPLCREPLRDSNTTEGWIRWGLKQEAALRDCNIEIRKANGQRTKS